MTVYESISLMFQALGGIVMLLTLVITIVISISNKK